MQDFPAETLWNRPAGVASVGFHLQHLSGVLDRLCTYARGEQLDSTQTQFLEQEGRPSDIGVADLVEAFHIQVERTLEQLRATEDSVLTQARAVGRGRLPSTVLGLLVHAAEHVQRHVGQLLVTVRIQQK